MPPEIITRLKIAARMVLKGSPSPATRLIDIPAISTEEIAEVRQFFPLEKYFVFGHARSGTTLLARLVRVHPQVHCNWQGHFFTRPPLLQSLVASPEIAAWLGRRSNRWNHGKDLSPLVLRGACDLILEREARQLGKRIVGDKSPNSLVDGEAVRLMHQVYPDARLVYIVRDGRDAALSHRFQSFIDVTQHLSPEDFKIRQAFIQNAEPFLSGQRSVFTPKGLRQAAQGWVRNVEETNQAGIEYYGDQYFSLRFEDLLRDPWGKMCKLWSFLGADVSLPSLEQALQGELQQNPDADWQQQKASQIAQPLQKGKSGSWREMFTQQNREVFQDIAGQTLHAWGYPLE